MTLEACRDHYSRANTWKVVSTFFRVFSVRGGAPGLMMNNMHKDMFLQHLKEHMSHMAQDLAP